MPLFPEAGKRKAEVLSGAVGMPVDGTGVSQGSGGGGSSQDSGGAYGLTRGELDTLCVRVAQVVSIHDHQIRELRTLLRRVKLPTSGRVGKELSQLDKEWKDAVRAGKAERLGNKHAKLAIRVINAVFDDPSIGDQDKSTMTSALSGVDSSKEGEVEKCVNVMKWKELKGGKEGVLEFRLVAELAAVEGIMVKVLGASGGTVLTTPEPRQPQIRDVDELIQGTWKRR